VNVIVKAVHSEFARRPSVGFRSFIQSQSLEIGNRTTDLPDACASGSLVAKSRLMRLLYAASIVLAVAVAVKAQDVAAAIEAITHAEGYKTARWGILFVDAKTGEVVYAREAEQMFAPASVTKLFSCAAAIVALGPDHTFKTPVYSIGDIKDGVLEGDLVLVASGDLTFGGRTGKGGVTEFKNADHTYADGTPGGAELTDTDPLATFKELAKKVKGAGITKVTGEVLVDDRLFNTSEGSGSGPRVVSPMLANDNLIDMTFTAGKAAGDLATVELRPDTKYLNRDIEVATVAGKREKIVLDVVNAEPAEFVLRGRVPMGTKPLVGILTMRRPADYARTLFIECLKAEGVHVMAPLVKMQAASELPRDEKYTDLKPVATFTSRPFHEMITVTLKVSHNLYASTLPHLVAVKRNAGKSLADGLRAQGAVLKEIGINPMDVSFAGGAGGMNADHVSPKVTVQLLQAMRKRPEWEHYKTALPVMGVDGTLASIGKDSAAKGNVFAKTGTLGWTDFVNDRNYLTSKALAGVMTTKSGRELTFAVFLNDKPLPAGVKSSSEGKTLGRICEAVYEAVK
jgi:D-alanyl-D-alanine carboxypeptidase/D-alanyl-D-alanine-endopeptidase (penicillin-binding protein 4)